MVTTLKQALLEQQVTCEHSLFIRSDNGPQMSSRNFQAGLENLPVQHEFIPCRSPNDNAYVESFNSQLEVGCLSTQRFESYGTCYEAVVSYIEFYNKRRIHGVLGMSPEEFENQLKGNNNCRDTSFNISA